VARRQLRHLLNNRILNYSLRHPCLHILGHLHNRTLGELSQGLQQHHLYEVLSFDFKTTLILNSAIVWLDDHMSCNSSTSYSCWCSHLNQTTHIAWSSNHFPYSVTLGTKGPTISRLSTRAPFRKPQLGSTKPSHFIPLSWFI